MAIKYLDSKRIRGTATERSALSVATLGSTTTVGSLTDVVFEADTEIGDITYSGNEITLSADTYSRHGINGSEYFQNSGTQTLTCDATHVGGSSWVFFGLASAKAVEVGSTESATPQMEYAIRGADDNRTWYKTGTTTWTQASNTHDNSIYKIVNDRSTVTYYVNENGGGWTSMGTTTHGTPASAYYSMCLVAQTGSAGSFEFQYSGDVRISTLAHPNLPAGTIFEQTNDYKYWIWNGTDTWTVMVAN